MTEKLRLAGIACVEIEPNANLDDGRRAQFLTPKGIYVDAVAGRKVHEYLRSSHEALSGCA